MNIKKQNLSIAVLLTCFNRVETTLKCLEKLYKATVPVGYQFDVFLVDDNSPDKTGKLVKEKYPLVNVIMGTGDLYWNGGMRLAWNTASQIKDYDFYLWLNDDTLIESQAIDNIILDYNYLKGKNIESLIVSALKDPYTKEITYSGRMEGIKVIPCGNPTECTYITGNFVLVSKIIFNKVGNLESLFSHGMGDNDYGFRTIKAGFKCHVTSFYMGYCKLNNKIQWHDSRNTLQQRFKLLFSKTDGNIIEYLQFVKIHRGSLTMYLSASKTLIRLVFPKFIN
ncbi:MAG: glycosyltransferase [Lutibacter sp.]